MVMKPLKSLGISIIVWIGGLSLYMLIRHYGVNDDLGVPPQLIIIETIKLGLMLGTIWWASQYFVKTSYFKSQSVLRITLFRVVMALGMVLLSTVMVLYTVYYFQGRDPIQFFLAEYPRLLPFTLYLMLMMIVYEGVSQAQALIGGRVLKDILIGKYLTPQQEERIFMFLDLKSSTAIAEDLGHHKFSQLIQDCFRDLAFSSTNNDIDIYRYVGDEAILTWTIENGVKNANCIRVFYEFKKYLIERSDYYQNTYGYQPVFKAGVNSGTVTVAEVGVLKREIAYLSDVLNTTARLEAACSTYGKNLLISGEIKDLLKNEKSVFFEEIDEITLTGKKHKTHIYYAEITAD